MARPASPYDKRKDFFEGYFHRGKTYEEYLSSGDPALARRWREVESAIALTEAQKALLSGFKRRMNVLVISGLWCGDCSRQLPLLRAFEVACPVIACRYHDNQEVPELRDELRINGGERVPVAVCLSEDFFELSRFGDRTLSAYRRKAARELGAACDISASPAEVSEELSEWLAWLERDQLLLRVSPMLRNRYGD